MIIKIMHLYPDLLNLYGDSGNIEALRRRLLWRGYEVEVVVFTTESETLDLSDVDILFLGGGTDKEERLALESLRKYKDDIKKYIEDEGVLVALCGGFSMLGKSYPSGDERIDGLNVLDIKTEISKNRFSGDVVIKSNLLDTTVVGFENHGVETDIGMYQALGEVLVGNGNNGEDKTEGLTYKNVVASYLHGPLLPKNPKLCDYILLNAIKRRDESVVELSPLDDAMENMAHDLILKRYNV